MMLASEFFDRGDSLTDRARHPVPPGFIRLTGPLPGHHTLDRSHVKSLPNLREHGPVGSPEGLRRDR